MPSPSRLTNPHREAPPSRDGTRQPQPESSSVLVLPLLPELLPPVPLLVLLVLLLLPPTPPSGASPYS